MLLLVRSTSCISLPRVDRQKANKLITEYWQSGESISEHFLIEMYGNCKCTVVVHKTIIRPIEIYGNKAWILKEKLISKVNETASKIPGTIQHDIRGTT